MYPMHWKAYSDNFLFLQVINSLSFIDALQVRCLSLPVCQSRFISYTSVMILLATRDDIMFVKLQGNWCWTSNIELECVMFAHPLSTQLVPIIISSWTLLRLYTICVPELTRCMSNCPCPLSNVVITGAILSREQRVARAYDKDIGFVILMCTF